MSTKRVLGSSVDLKGDTINGLNVGDYVSRTPMRWATTCTQCKTQSVHSHALLVSGGAKCGNAGCGKQHLRDYANDSPQKARERYRAEEAAKRQAADDRRDAEKAKLETQFKDTAVAYGKEVRQAILAGRDPELYVSKDTRGINMTQSAAKKFNSEQAELCVQQHPEMRRYNNSKNVEAIGSYLDNHKVNIISAETLYRAFERLRQYGLLDENPAPTPQPAYKPITEYQDPEPPPASIVQKQIGYDFRTGEQREFTPHEVALMGSDEYRRAFRVYKADLVLPNRALF